MFATRALAASGAFVLALSALDMGYGHAVRRQDADGPAHAPIAGAVTVRRAVRHDVGVPLLAYQSTAGVRAFRRATGRFTRWKPSPRSAASIEQTTEGTRPPAALVARFDGLGADFVGPQGNAYFSNPSDNSLAVGPNHIVQIV